jgi:uncharacterized membrane-anchored protein
MRPAGLPDHPDRAEILAEVHARPLEMLGRPARVRRVALLLERAPDAVARAARAFSSWCERIGVVPPQPGSRQHSVDYNGRHVTWELHTEFVTITWVSRLEDGENWPEDIGFDAFDRAAVIAAMRIDVIDEDHIPERILNGFRIVSLCHSTIDRGRGEIATDFTPDADGYTRFELAARNMPPLRLAIIARRLLEIETYRTLALLGLPLARSVSPELTAAEGELGAAIAALGRASNPESERVALDVLHNLSVRAGQLVEQTNYRFSASHAYGDILRRRYGSLHEESLKSATTIERYLSNRVDPALATCRTVEQRMLALGEKIERGIGLLNTRISLDIQTQNRAVLTNIANTSKSQFRLQRTVEGLSTIAISYYLLGIVSYVLNGVAEWAHFSKPVAIALAAPVILLLVWVSVRAIRGKHPEAD